MKQISLLLLFLCTAVCVVQAQRPGPINPQKDKQVYEGVTINIVPAQGGTYLFDILEGPLLLSAGRRNNPATLLPKGFASKDDAYKVAKWMIKQYKKDGHLPPIIPPHVLDELKIKKENLYKS